MQNTNVWPHFLCRFIDFFVLLSYKKFLPPKKAKRAGLIRSLNRFFLFLLQTIVRQYLRNHRKIGGNFFDCLRSGLPMHPPGCALLSFFPFFAALVLFRHSSTFRTKTYTVSVKSFRAFCVISSVILTGGTIFHFLFLLCICSVLGIIFYNYIIPISECQEFSFLFGNII